MKQKSVFNPGVINLDEQVPEVRRKVSNPSAIRKGLLSFVEEEKKGSEPRFGGEN